MLNLKKDKFFFFDTPCSNIHITSGSIEHGYLAILNDDLDSAQKIFSTLDSPRAKWGNIFVSILKGYLSDYPTYFEIRNFLEIDLDFLIKNEKLDYIEQILGSIDLLSTKNHEIYKYVARVMFENKLFAAALKYMEKSKKMYYNDAELHFLLSKYYTHVHDYEEALYYINECLKLIPDYYPALSLKQQIETMSF